MMYKNKEGYPDPTAGEAISNMRMPPQIWRAYKMLQAAAKAAGLEITRFKDRSGKEWKL